MDLVPHVRIQFRRTYVRVQVQPETQTEDDSDARNLAVRENRLGHADGSEHDRVRGFAGVEGAVRPLFARLQVMLPAARIGDEVERETVRHLDGLQDLHALPHHLGSHSVSGEKDDLEGHRADGWRRRA